MNTKTFLTILVKSLSDPISVRVISVSLAIALILVPTSVFCAVLFNFEGRLKIHAGANGIDITVDRTHKH